MKVTIVNGNLGDDQVIYNGEVFNFSLVGLIDDDIWAVQFADGEGEVEYRNRPAVHITDMESFENIITVCQGILDERAAAALAEQVDIPHQKGLKLREVSIKRDSLLLDSTATVDVNGLTWQVGPSSTKSLTEALALYSSLGSTPVGLEWRDVDNTNHPASLTLLQSIASERALYIQDVWQKSWALKDMVHTATTLSQVAAISWNSA